MPNGSPGFWRMLVTALVIQAWDFAAGSNFVWQWNCLRERKRSALSLLIFELLLMYSDFTIPAPKQGRDRLISIESYFCRHNFFPSDTNKIQEG